MGTVLIGVGFVIGTIVLALGVYLLMRKLVSGPFEAETETLAGSVIFRVSALHGLILALVFAQELVDFNGLQTNLVREATAIADIFNDARRYDSEAAEPMQADLSRYVHVVINEEWQLLADRQRLSGEAWQLREKVYLAVLDLEPQTAREKSLRDHMLHRIQLIAELRQERENTALHATSPLFWVAALAGVVLIMVPYFIFTPNVLHLSLLSIYAGFAGIVMFLIYAFADPFSSPGALEPWAFERLLETEIGAAATN